MNNASHCKLYGTMKPKSGSDPIFPEKQAGLSKTSSRISFSEVLIDLLKRFTITRECHLLRLHPCNANFRGSKYHKMHSHMTCLDNPFDFLSKQPAEFVKSWSQMTIWPWYSTIQGIFLGYISSTGNNKERNGNFIFALSQVFCSPNLLAAFFSSGYQSPFF